MADERKLDTSKIAVDDDGYEESDSRKSSGKGASSARETVGNNGKNAVNGAKTLRKGKTFFRLVAVWSVLDAVKTRRDSKNMKKVARQIRKTQEEMKALGGSRSDSYGSVFSDAFEKSFMEQKMRVLEKQQEKLEHRKEKREARVRRVGGIAGMAMGIGQAARTESMKAFTEKLTGQQGGIRGEEMAGITARQASSEYEPEV